jgi:NitT/TauT family transport system substrate-binding protein
MRWIRTIALFVLLGFVAAAGQAAETKEIRLARQFSMGYIQFNLMEKHRLLEKHAKALGLGDVKVTWLTFNGPSMMNDALLSGEVDIVSGGVPGLLTVWTKTRGTPQEVRGVSALSSQPFLLNTRNPAIKSIRDFTEKDRIALPGVKVSVQAVTLQMAAAKEFGEAAFAKLDPLTVSMSPPDSTTGLLAGTGGFTSVFGVPPFQYQQLEHPGIRTVLNSFDVMGGPHTFTVAWTSKRFRDANPKTYQALVAALKEATELLNKDKRAGGDAWIEGVKSKLTSDFVFKVVSGPQVEWTLAPNNTLRYATFMHKVGSINHLPASWKDLFFPEIHDLSGS